MKRTRLAALALCSLISAPAFAADDLPPTPKPVPLQLTLKDAAARAVQRAVPVRVARTRELSHHLASEALRGLFLPALFADVHQRQGSDALYGPAFTFLRPYPTVVTQVTSVEAGLHGRFSLGTEYRLSGRTETLFSDGPVALSPLYTQTLQLTLEQPLLRFFGREVNEAPIVIERLESAQANRAIFEEAQQALRLMTLRYFNVYRAVGVQQARERAVQDSKRFLELTEKLVSGGKLPPAATILPRSEIAAREADLLAARVDSERARQDLLQVLQPDSAESFEVVTADEPRRDLPLIATSEAVRQALQSRPRIEIASLKLKSAHTSLLQAESALRSDLRVYATGMTRGISGTDRCTSGYLADGLTPCQVPDQFSGGPALSARNLVSGTIYAGEVGVKLDLPFQNANANAQAELARGNVRAAEEELDAAKTQVVLDARRAAELLLLAQSRLSQADISVKLARESMASEQKRFELASATAIDVVRAQERVTQSEIQQVQSVADFNAAWWELEWATGRIAADLGIDLSPLQSSEQSSAEK